MELNVSNLKQWGINYYNFIGDNVAGRSGFTTDIGASKSFFDAASDKGGILSFGAGSKVSITPPGGSAVSIPSLVGFVNFLSSITNVNVLSTPTIMALDNEEAEIEVGENVPVGQTSTTGANGATSTSQDRQDATIKLNIKPHISPGSSTMRLEITQNIKELGQTKVNAKNLDDNAVSINKRNAKTNVLVHDQDTIVLGGLIKDKESVTVTKVPLLGDIPIIGWLFKGKRTETAKTNLMMFITPKIIRNSEAASQLVTSKMKERLNFIEKNMGGKDSQGDALDQLRLEKNGKNVELK
jgi:general secretion pathway protein D